MDRFLAHEPHFRTQGLRQVLTLAIAPAVGLGVARFAYALVLPDMRADLGWSWAEAGRLNTSAALGYLLGASLAASAIARFGARRMTVCGTAACVVSLGLCGLSRDPTFLNVARTLAGLGGGIAFVAGGTLAAAVAARDAARSGFLLAVYYAGAGVGIVLSAMVVPPVLHLGGPSAWTIAWAALAAASTPLLFALAVGTDANAPASARAEDRSLVHSLRMQPMLLGYALFGAGYIAYMTFMIAWVRDAGGAPLEQALFWFAIGGAAACSPWIWARALERLRHGYAFALLCGVTALGAALPLVLGGPGVLFVSAALFGSAFFAVVASTTAFVRRNVPSSSWGRAIGTSTVCFGVGQMLGPIAAGEIIDRTHGLTGGLAASALLLLVGAAVGSAQRDRPASEDPTAAP